ncbi:MAG: glycosyltransferase family 61 protein, partial [Pseudomonadota bacterium]
MISLRPTETLLRKLMRRPVADLFAGSTDRWEVSPGSNQYVPPAVYLPGQLERIVGTEFASLEEVIE